VHAIILCEVAGPVNAAGCGRAGQGGKAEYEAFHKPGFQRIVILTKANTLSMGKYFLTGLPI
jgi:hypothetical protein